jgi:DNA-binding transcriptional regulator YiaG
MRRAQTMAARQYIPATIRKLRRDMKLTQAQLGKSLVTPVDQATISNWESGKTELTACQLLDIMMLFGKPNFLSLIEQTDMMEEKQSA